MIFNILRVPFSYLSYFLVAFSSSDTAEKVKIGFPCTVDPEIDLGVLGPLILLS